jgi:hypothetical protein
MLERTARCSENPRHSGTLVTTTTSFTVRDMNSTPEIHRISKLAAFFAAAVALVASALPARSQLSTTNGYLTDAALPAPTVQTSIVVSNPFPIPSLHSDSTVFGINGPSSLPSGLFVYASTGGGLSGDGVLDPGVGAGFTVTADANSGIEGIVVNSDVSYSFEVLGGVAGTPVSIDYVGNASITAGSTIGPQGVYGFGNANVTIIDETESEPEIFEVGLAAFNPGTYSVSAFPSPIDVIAGDVYTVTLSTQLEEDGGNLGVSMSSAIDPQLIVDLSNPGYSIAYSPGLPGSSGSDSGNNVPDATSTIGLFAFGMGCIAVFSRKFAR